MNSEIKTEEEVSYGESVAVDDFLNEMAERGLIVPGPVSPWKRFVELVKAPYYFVAGIFSWIAWHVYGKFQYRRSVEFSLERWKKLAGLQTDPSTLDYSDLARERREHANRILASKPATDGDAQALHKQIIRNTVINPPRPDVDDTGLK